MINIDDIEKRVLYEDNHLIIINKRAGEIVQGDITGDIPLLEKVRAYLKETYQKPNNVFCGLVHRIDRPVSGIIVFAKTSKALSRMNELVKERKMKKIYHAIVENSMSEPEGVLVHYMKKNEQQNKSYLVNIAKEGYKRAELKYRIVGQSKSYTLVEVELITGRHHQIRAQLSTIGTPIKGDLKYGAKRSNSDGSISLHAGKVEFEHPVSHQVIAVTATALSDEFVKIWSN